MYKYNEITTLHVELTSNCQASCPMCARNHHGGPENPLLHVQDITLDQFKTMCPDEFLQQLYMITFCGNFGDPLVAKDIFPIVEHIAKVSPATRIDVHTNGSIRSTEWWANFAKVLPKDHLVQFGIDGLEDTHALYRVGTHFNKIIENAKAFIDAGGKARWNFITFKHNEHQLEQCRQLAKDLGFDSFHEKQTSRFIGDPWFNVMDRKGNVTHKLEGPTEQKVIFIDRKTVENYKDVISKAKIVCEVEGYKSVYIDALGYLWPCCFVGATPYIHSYPDQLVHTFRLDSQDSLNKVVERLGGTEALNLAKHSIQEIVDSYEWQTVWDESFAENRPLVCARTCGKFDEPVISQCRDQFLDLKEFNE